MKLLMENWNNFLSEKCEPGQKFDGETGKPCPAADSTQAPEAEIDFSKLAAQVQAYHKKAPAGSAGHDEIFSPLWQPWMAKSKQIKDQFKAALKANVSQRTPESQQDLDKFSKSFDAHITTLPQLAAAIFQSAQKQNIQLGREVTGMLLKVIQQAASDNQKMDAIKAKQG